MTKATLLKLAHAALAAALAATAAWFQHIGQPGNTLHALLVGVAVGVGSRVVGALLQLVDTGSVP